MATAFRGVSIGLPYEMMLTVIFKYFKVPCDGQTTLKSNTFDELTFGRMSDETVSSIVAEQKLNKRQGLGEVGDECASNQAGGQITLQAI